jgi:PEP-CTERM motif
MMNLMTKFHGVSEKTVALVMLIASSLLVVQSAEAGVAIGGWVRSSSVDSLVQNNNNGTWTYNYTLNNISQFTETGPDQQPFIVDWELPWFGDAGIDTMSILSPGGWTFNIETIGVANAATGWEGIASWQDPNDPFFFGANSPFSSVTQVLHWYSLCWVANGDAEGCGEGGALDDAIAPGNSLLGFGFDALFDETDAPYQASWAFLPIRSGDPAFPLGGIPNSPLAGGFQVVPEPGLLGLLGIGLMAVMLGRRRRD